MGVGSLCCRNCKAVIWFKDFAQGCFVKLSLQRVKSSLLTKNLLSKNKMKGASSSQFWVESIVEIKLTVCLKLLVIGVWVSDVFCLLQQCLKGVVICALVGGNCQAAYT